MGMFNHYLAEYIWRRSHVHSLRDEAFKAFLKSAVMLYPPLVKDQQSDSYFQILAQSTPQQSGVKSSFLQKCISFGSTKKGLSFNDSNNSHNEVSRDVSLSLYSPRSYSYSEMNINQEEDKNSDVEFSKLKSQTNVTRGEFDTTIYMDIGTGIQGMLDFIF
ncbi:hypothetical protein TNCV_2343331 [Trichonephila clavipes]|nr:hypothetical protein TNCV_2343331 [Trichonephila clavipes]